MNEEQKKMETKWDAMQQMHQKLLEALRHREQDIFRYVAILAPALGGYIWLLTQPHSSKGVFVVGTLSIILLLLLGAVYCLTLGYNYRYITLQVARFEKELGLDDHILRGWPRSPKEFIRRYRVLFVIPWCVPPDMLKVFWLAFLFAIAGITLSANTIDTSPDPLNDYIIYPFNQQKISLQTLSGHTELISVIGAISFLIAVTTPIYYGYKLNAACRKEKRYWP